MPAKVIGEADLGKRHRRALDRGVDGGEQGGRGAGLDHGERLAVQPQSGAENGVMQHRVDVAQEDAARQRVLDLAKLGSDEKGFFGAGDTAADQDQESPGMNRSTTQQGNRRAFDHQVAGEDA